MNRDKQVLFIGYCSEFLMLFVVFGTNENVFLPEKQMFIERMRRAGGIHYNRKISFKVVNYEVSKKYVRCT